ncbi:iron ABC transporter ATP-binding protein [Corynebacterium kutscheri]|uniref:ABC-type cobalamin/Fe3+-siderophore transport system, ATPase component n=1 Tax=Corynebacterium kutscheri TaxID=35755 RepID=A0A0F6QZA8_9CORY|nr:ABC transporter ATP-binding protein [Corynebacterium kutscheri]AKE41042.1 ABC-type cobalamin/Fe3+-siderophore transport system, ATPase component [Corynebacterium kutscheri]VEH06931.1 iron ABC transporter ATP-binding protein [Corynebacterium kutscheri]VEH09340.1 iron ABC transporter ATP-binding protein [Corynebacterium kutscheri]VEH79427.1 iron ABC transporter ATP-binding protein [Corynebacterium kutscheri]
MLESARLRATNISVGYDSTVINKDVTVDIPNGKVTTIIGANGCGKSTLLRGLSRLLPLQAGSVTLDGQELSSYKHKELARKISMLPQSPTAPPGLTVADLVARGRHPHQTWLQQWSPSHSEAVDKALELTGISDFAERSADSLSGGQRQRVWISMVLAQDTDIVFLDEPTTYLDLAHSIEVLDLVRTLNKTQGKTIVMVLHDLNLAARYSDELIIMQKGQLAAHGSPKDILNETALFDAFGLRSRIIEDPCAGGPLIVPEA